MTKGICELDRGAKFSAGSSVLIVAGASHELWECFVCFGGLCCVCAIVVCVCFRWKWILLLENRFKKYVCTL